MFNAFTMETRFWGHNAWNLYRGGFGGQKGSRREKVPKIYDDYSIGHVNQPDLRG